MENPVLSVRNLTKRYALQRAGIAKADESILALNDLTFDLQKGEILGIIGPNGAGKSTLLKVLSEVSPPTAGTAEYEGKLTSILEVGTGFHPDLSGRENVFLSASFRGLGKQQVKAVYDEIVAFSGLADFMEMPVKNYSSGMYLRLAFSVAFHAPIDILLVDEVLAVGDADFRNKCHTRIREIAASGASIILVSHNTSQIVEFCQRCLLLNEGQLVKEGRPLEVIEHYMEMVSAKTDSPKEQRTIGPIEIRSIAVETEQSSDTIKTTDNILVTTEIEKQENDSSLEVTLILMDVNGHRVLMDANGLRQGYKPSKLGQGSYQISCRIPANLLNRGVYTVGLAFSSNKKFLGESLELTRFKVEIPPDSTNEEFYTRINCPILPQLDWNIKPIAN